MTLKRTMPAAVAAIVAVTIVAVTIVAVTIAIATAGSAPDRGGDPRDVPRGHSRVEPYPERAPSQISPPGVPPSVPVADSSGAGCPARWSRFVNPALHYAMCYPPGWGFLDTTQANPPAAVEGRELYHLRLAPPALFPWEPDTSVARGVAERGGWVITILWDTAAPTSACTSTESRQTHRGARAGWCTVTYDLDGAILPSPTGTYATLQIEVPLTTAPLPPVAGMTTDTARLIVEVTSRRTDADVAAASAWEILDTLELL